MQLKETAGRLAESSLNLIKSRVMPREVPVGSIP